MVLPALQWLDGPAMSGVINAISISLLVANMWPDREWWMKGLSKTAQHARAGLINIFAEAEAMTPFDAHLRRKMDESRQVRFGYYIFALKVSSAIFFPTSCVMSLMMVHPADMTIPLLFFQTFGFVASRYCKYAQSKLMFKILMCGILCRSFIISRSSWFLMQSGSRALQRIIVGIGILDYRCSTRWNVLLSAGICTVFHFCSATFLAQDLGRSSTEISIIHALSEVMVCITVCGLLYALEALEALEVSRVRTSVESSEARKALTAARKLLSVLCDAQVHVGAESEILFCNTPLRHLLLSGKRVADSELLGTNFLQYVAGFDQARFRDFIAGGNKRPSSVAKAASNSSESSRNFSPAASIQIHLRNSDGHHFQVEVFHVEFPDLNGSLGHLMGIRETGTHLREALVDAPGMVAFSKGPALHSDQLDDEVPVEAAAMRPEAAECPVEAAAMEVELQSTDIETDQRQQLLMEAGSAHSSDSSGVSSQSSYTSQGQVDTGVKSVTMSVNLNSRRMRVNEILLTFDASSRRCPGLADWMQAVPFIGFSRDCQQHVNEQFHGKGSAGKLGQVELAAKGEPFMCAESVKVSLEDDFDNVQLRLDGLSPLTWLPWARHGVRPRKRMRHPSKPMETMPPIDESHQAME